MTSANYVGRFAPSPTGPLHFGSLLAAMASYCDARSRNGIWQLRIDDIDPPRAMPDAAQLIPKTLNQYGFEWDGAIVFQSTRTDQYQQALKQLNEKGALFACRCSRRELKDHAIYPGTCRPATSMPDVLTATKQQIDKELGDTVVLRRDNFFSYALACAIDDARDVTHIVRGADLLSSTAPQINIMRLLGLRVPTYAHIPVALNTDQQKLSKQTHADALDAMPVLPTLLSAWQFLGQSQLNVHNVEAFWQAAFQTWQMARVPKLMGIPA